jgi:hypothetical protein
MTFGLVNIFGDPNRELDAGLTSNEKDWVLQTLKYFVGKDNTFLEYGWMGMYLWYHV